MRTSHRAINMAHERVMGGRARAPDEGPIAQAIAASMVSARDAHRPGLVHELEGMTADAARPIERTARTLLPCRSREPGLTEATGWCGQMFVHLSTSEPRRIHAPARVSSRIPDDSYVEYESQVRDERRALWAKALRTSRRAHPHRTHERPRIIDAEHPRNLHRLDDHPRGFHTVRGRRKRPVQRVPAHQHHHRAVLAHIP